MPLLRALDAQLTPLLEAQRAGDWITVADILEYDIAPLMPRFDAVLDSLRCIVGSANSPQERPRPPFGRAAAIRCAGRAAGKHVAARVKLWCRATDLGRARIPISVSR